MRETKLAHMKDTILKGSMSSPQLTLAEELSRKTRSVRDVLEGKYLSFTDELARGHCENSPAELLKRIDLSTKFRNDPSVGMLEYLKQSAAMEASLLLVPESKLADLVQKELWEPQALREMRRFDELVKSLAQPSDRVNSLIQRDLNWVLGLQPSIEQWRTCDDSLESLRHAFTEGTNGAIVSTLRYHDYWSQELPEEETVFFGNAEITLEIVTQFTQMGDRLLTRKGSLDVEVRDDGSNPEPPSGVSQHLDDCLSQIDPHLADLRRDMCLLPYTTGVKTRVTCAAYTARELLARLIRQMAPNGVFRSTIAANTNSKSQRKITRAMRIQHILGGSSEAAYVSSTVREVNSLYEALSEFVHTGIDDPEVARLLIRQTENLVLFILTNWRRQ